MRVMPHNDEPWDEPRQPAPPLGVTSYQSDENNELGRKILALYQQIDLLKEENLRLRERIRELSLDHHEKDTY